MATNRVKTEVRALREGMFVADLDRPWHETPFPLQGFYVRSQDDINALLPYCKFVYIDVHKTKPEKKTVNNSVAPATSKATIKQVIKKKSAGSLVLPPIVIKEPQKYHTDTPIKKEVYRTAKLHKAIQHNVKSVYEDINNGDLGSVKDVSRLTEGLVESIVRNPDALVWLSKMDEEDTHSYQHAVKCSIWSLVFARHLGLSKTLMKTLATGVILSYLGKLKVDSALLVDPEELEGSELAEYQGYVQKSVEILENMEGITEGVTSIARYHCERHNGSGFPNSLTGDSIPLLAKIAGLVDTYQTLISPRQESLGMSPLEAVSQLYELRNIQFQQDLVERFIEAIGVYPTGTLVELNSSEVGIVTGHNEERRLQPRLIVVLDADKQPLKRARIVDLMEWNESKSDDEKLFIKDSLPKGAFDIDENSYLLTGATSKWSLRHIAGSIGS